MPTVELRFNPQAAHVRTARLVAATVARRAGVDEDLLDEIRLAVGEACSRAVSLHRSAGLTEPVAINLHIDETHFSVEVIDAVSPTLHAALSDGVWSAAALADGVRSAAALADGDPRMVGGAAIGDDSLGLALISGLVDDVEIDPGLGGVRVRMAWPAFPV
ncbi:MAG: ATP-binding protein [Sporichthyaceae bacterium]